jgi:hypothetical protein
MALWRYPCPPRSKQPSYHPIIHPIIHPSIPADPSWTPLDNYFHNIYSISLARLYSILSPEYSTNAVRFRLQRFPTIEIDLIEPQLHPQPPPVLVLGLYCIASRCSSSLFQWSYQRLFWFNFNSDFCCSSRIEEHSNPSSSSKRANRLCSGLESSGNVTASSIWFQWSYWVEFGLVVELYSQISTISQALTLDRMDYRTVQHRPLPFTIFAMWRNTTSNERSSPLNPAGL